MSRLGRLGAGLRAMARDWRVGLVWTANILLVLVVLVTIDSISARSEARRLALESVRVAEAEAALAAEDRRAAEGRIASLDSTIAGLAAEVAQANSLAAQSATREQALASQVRALGARPVVLPPPAAAPAPAPGPPPPTAAPAPAPLTTTTAPSVGRQETTTTIRPRTTTTAPRTTTTVPRR